MKEEIKYKDGGKNINNNRVILNFCFKIKIVKKKNTPLI